jgi:hypothetical protein
LNEPGLDPKGAFRMVNVIFSKEFGYGIEAAAARRVRVLK